MNLFKKWEKFVISNKQMKYKTLTKSRRTKSIERKVGRTYRKTTGNSKKIRKKKLSLGS